MTVETCKIQYEVAKEKGNQEDMKFWAARAKLHGGVVEEEKPKKK